MEVRVGKDFLVLILLFFMLMFIVFVVDQVKDFLGTCEPEHFDDGPTTTDRCIDTRIFRWSPVRMYGEQRNTYPQP